MIGIVDAHEDMLTIMEKDLGQINYTLTTVRDMAEDTRTTLHITTTLEILINMQTLHVYEESNIGL